MEIVLHALVLAVAGAVSYALGRGLARFSNAARVIAGVLDVFAVLVGAVDFVRRLAALDVSPRGFAVLAVQATGLGVTVACGWVLLNERAAIVCSEAYARAEPHREPAAPTSSPFFWLLLTQLILGIAAA